MKDYQVGALIFAIMAAGLAANGSGDSAARAMFIVALIFLTVGNYTFGDDSES